MADVLTLNTDAVAIPRAELDAVIETLASLVQASGQAFSLLIDRLDRHEGDPDLEPSGDESDGDFAEDEPCARFHMLGNGPSCEISDAGEDNHDRERGDDGE